MYYISQKSRYVIVEKSLFLLDRTLVLQNRKQKSLIPSYLVIFALIQKISQLLNLIYLR